MPFEIVRNDITKMKVDAIVNAANTALQMGAGSATLFLKRREHGSFSRSATLSEDVKLARLSLPKSTGFPQSHHSYRRPIWQGGGHGEAKLLRDCYLNSLQLRKIITVNLSFSH